MGFFDGLSSLFGASGTGPAVTSAANLYGGIEQRQQQEQFFYQNIGAQKEANAENRAFNQWQADLSRAFNAQEAEKQRWFAAESSHDAMGFSRDEAEKARQFAERMSNSAHQREMADLKRAGLNPILAIAHAGASTPASSAPSGVAASGSAASGSPASSHGSVSSSLPNVQNILGSAAEAAKIIPELKNVIQQNKNLQEQERLTAAQSARETAQKMVLHEQVKKVAQETETEKHRTDATAAAAEKGKADAAFYGNKFMQWLRYGGNVGSELQRILAPANSARTVQQMLD